RLDHPAIARLLDGGTAPDGRPYLATEFVDGEPITAYCDRRRLSVNERLALFGEVCEAVAAAHRQLVVHRDLKPSNVLVEGTRNVGTGDSGTSSPQSPVPGPQSPVPSPPESNSSTSGLRSCWTPRRRSPYRSRSPSGVC
ncbi:MAG: protein kinase, partial [Bacteroidota bacterium]